MKKIARCIRSPVSCMRWVNVKIAQDKPDKVFQSLVAVKSSDKEEEKVWRKKRSQHKIVVLIVMDFRNTTIQRQAYVVFECEVFEREVRKFQSSLSLNVSVPHMYSISFSQVYHSNHKNITCITPFIELKNQQVLVKGSRWRYCQG